MTKLCFLSALELGAAYRARTLAPSEVTAAVLRQIDTVNPAVNAFVTVVADVARTSAAQSDRRFARDGWWGRSMAIPLGIKDLSPDGRHSHHVRIAPCTSTTSLISMRRSSSG